MCINIKFKLCIYFDKYIIINLLLILSLYLKFLDNIIKNNMENIFKLDYSKNILTILVQISHINYPIMFSKISNIPLETFNMLRKPNLYGEMKQSSQKIWKLLQKPDSRLRKYLSTLPHQKINKFINDIQKYKDEFTFTYIFHIDNITLHRKMKIQNGILNLSGLDIMDNEIYKIIKQIHQIKIYPLVLNLQQNLITNISLFDSIIKKINYIILVDNIIPFKSFDSYKNIIFLQQNTLQYFQNIYGKNIIDRHLKFYSKFKI